jgi:hypothetical protein
MRDTKFGKPESLIGRTFRRNGVSLRVTEAHEDAAEGREVFPTIAHWVVIGGPDEAAVGSATDLAEWLDEAEEVVFVRHPVMQFAERMEHRLSAHDGDRTGWDGDKVTDEGLLVSIEECVEALVGLTDDRITQHVPLEARIDEAIIKKATDIGNYAMMLADRALARVREEK